MALRNRASIDTGIPVDIGSGGLGPSGPDVYSRLISAVANCRGVPPYSKTTTYYFVTLETRAPIKPYRTAAKMWPLTKVSRSPFIVVRNIRRYIITWLSDGR